MVLGTSTVLLHEFRGIECERRTDTKEQTLVRMTWAKVLSTFQPLKAIMNHAIGKHANMAWIVESQREAVKKHKAMEIYLYPGSL